VSQVVAIARGAAVTSLVWAPAGTLAWLTLRAADVGISSSNALGLGMLAFVLFVASLLGGAVTGSALVDRVFTESSLAARSIAAPLVALLVEEVAAAAAGRWDAGRFTAYVGAAVVGALAGAYLVVVRERLDEDTFHDRARDARAASRRRTWTSS
jgi:hypothetical protein